MNTEVISTEIRAFLCSTNGTDAIDVHTDLLDVGLLNSLLLMDLLAFICCRYHIELQADDLTPSNLSTISNIVAMISQRLLGHPDNCSGQLS